MRRVLLTSVAVTALVGGLGVAAAQQDRRGDPPAAEQTQQPPRARDQQAPPARGTVKEWPGSRAQQEPQGPARAQPERSTTGQSNDRPADHPRTQRGQGDVRERSTTGQSSPADQPRMQRERTTTGQSQERDVTRETPRRGEARPARGSARMSDEQRTRVSTRFSARIDSMNVRPLSRSQVSVSIGATIPRSVRAYTVPRDIVAIYPRFRGHRFVVVEDDIVIVEPGSYRVVATLPRSGEQRAARSFARETTGIAPAGSRIRLSPQDREVIRTVVLREPACRLEQRLDFVLFIPVPRTVEVCELPPQIVSEVPEVSGYRYVVRDGEIALVDPDERRIVEVIR